MNKIIITVEGGCVQGVEGIPPGVVLEIHDHDFEDKDDPVVATWFSDSDSGLSKPLSELESELLMALEKAARLIDGPLLDAITSDHATSSDVYSIQDEIHDAITKATQL